MRYTVSLLATRRKAARHRLLMPVPYLNSSGVYQIRRRVPKELRAKLGNEYKRSLNTRDPAVARVEHAKHMVLSDTLFANARAAVSNGGEITLGEANQFAADWYHAEKARLEREGDFDSLLAESGSSALEDGGYREDQVRMVSLRTAAKEGDDYEVAGAVETALRGAIRIHGRVMPPEGSESHRRLFNAFQSHMYSLSDLALDRRRGVWNSTPNVAPPSAHRIQAPAALTLNEDCNLTTVFDRWAEKKKLEKGEGRDTLKTISTYRTAVQQFIELTGESDVRRVTRKAVARFLETAAKLPTKGSGIRSLTATQQIEKAKADGLPLISKMTLKNKLMAVSAVLSYAQDMGDISENPVAASGLGKRIRKAAVNQQSANAQEKFYSAEEISAIFTSPIYSAGGWRAPRSDFGEAWYWIPVLMYYTGARLEEIAQLYVGDVDESTHGFWYIRILTNADDNNSGRTVKTPGSRRNVPLHDDVLNRGFAKYFRSIPSDGQLFPKLKKDSFGYYGSHFGRGWGNYLRKVVGLQTNAKPSHGFRHTFKALARDANIPEDIHDAITGHADNKVSRDYGRKSMPQREAEALKRFPSIDSFFRKNSVE